jgi:hypothetical protein
MAQTPEKLLRKAEKALSKDKKDISVVKWEPGSQNPPRDYSCNFKGVQLSTYGDTVYVYGEANLIDSDTINPAKMAEFQATADTWIANHAEPEPEEPDPQTLDDIGALLDEIDPEE